MRWSLYIGKVAGIKLFIHWTFFFFLAWIIIGNVRNGSNFAQSAYALAFILSIFICIVLHEFGHALVAKRFKYRTKDITLLPIGGMARMEEIPENPRHELLVAIAGPLVNVVIAGIIAVIFFMSGFKSSGFDAMINTPEKFFFNLMWVNISLAVFNLLPGFPMDGGRILRAILSITTGNRTKATRIASTIGQVTAVIFVLIGLFMNPILAIIGVFIFLAARAENEQVKSKSLLQESTVNDVVMRKFYPIKANDTVEDAARLLLDVQATDFIVMNDGAVVGTLSQQEIIRALSENGKNIEVQTVMNRNVKFLKPEMHLDKIYTEFLSNGTTIMPVMKDEKVIGVLDVTNILEYLMIKGAIEKEVIV